MTLAVLSSLGIWADFKERLMIWAIGGASSCAQSLSIRFEISSMPSDFFLLNFFKCYFTSGIDTCENLKMLFEFSCFWHG